MSLKLITSTQNPLVKQILVLKEKSRERRKSGLFVIEGQRELQLAVQANYKVEKVLFYPELISEASVNNLVDGNVEYIEISKEVFQKLAHRDTTEGLIALAQSKSHELANLDFSNDHPLILIAEAPEKPGNIGALLRTADAANVDAVIIANPKSDLYNPNIIRSSVGCVFTNNIVMGSTEDILNYLKDQNINIYCAALKASEAYHKQDFKQASAIVVGTEATGLTEEWLNNSTKNIIIPMQGKIDSMNVSVASGILIFEAKRQRNFN
ncbi:RNA methyltransferase [Psychroserpens sp.]|uniref:TrmH family RNA methyltransferase n=1 Tax=Psychroserpens sp. TaxID=2020870 RepID=UPI001B095FCF|nr:RNA methyltransferase [Psychroserpens sp.]MBO6606312.1 RNA methyltransferase [Psychroserpens sp.]MBO6632802.1 RNA methyltransferase [Psychroserpens sp.]MBO6653016.1 RNA methyltransferase [Psychroserpens sp.]MBO6680957.1 RNA methyltransferase [Psychroserpens sp.]MBO6750087.1 RNA methyltransferase [Psychroserpens sp.]